MNKQHGCTEEAINRHPGIVTEYLDNYKHYQFIAGAKGQCECVFVKRYTVTSHGSEHFQGG